MIKLKIYFDDPQSSAPATKLGVLIWHILCLCRWVFLNALTQSTSVIMYLRREYVVLGARHKGSRLYFKNKFKEKYKESSDCYAPIVNSKIDKVIFIPSCSHNL